MSEQYTYSKRHIATCQGNKVARASETGQSVENAKALYLRPLLVHSGPMVHFTPQQPYPNAWSWIHFGVDAEKNTLLDQASVLIQHSKGTLDLTLMVVLVTAASPPDSSGDLVKSSVPVSFTAYLKQYANGSSTPTTIVSQNLTGRLAAYPATAAVTYPILNSLYHGWRFDESGFYNKNKQSWGGILGDFTTNRRPAQLYPPDMELLTPVRLSLDFDSADFNPALPVLIEVRANYWDTDVSGVVFADSISPDNKYRNTVDYLDYIRMFCVASTMRERGTL